MLNINKKEEQKKVYYVTPKQSCGCKKKADDLDKIKKTKELQDKIFRMGHLGFVSDRDILMGLACLEKTLTKLGHKIPSPAQTLS